MANVVEFLKHFRKRAKENRPGSSKGPEVEAILSLTTEEFSRQDLAILVRSYLLGEDIYLISNEDCQTLVNGELVTYLPEELEAIYQLSPDCVKRVHRLKKLCDGQILKKGLKIGGEEISGQGGG